MATEKLGELVCVILKGKNLPNRQKIGKQDPFAMLRVGSEVKRTKADKNGGQRPEWDEEIRFTILDTPECKKMRISILADIGAQQKMVSGCVFNLTPVFDKGEFDDWVELKHEDKYGGEVYLELTFYSAKAPPPPTTRPKPRTRKISTISTKSQGTSANGTPSSIRARTMTSNSAHDIGVPSPQRELMNSGAGGLPPHFRPLPMPRSRMSGADFDTSYEYQSSPVDHFSPPPLNDSPVAFHAPRAVRPNIPDHVPTRSDSWDSNRQSFETSQCYQIPPHGYTQHEQYEYPHDPSHLDHYDSPYDNGYDGQHPAAYESPSHVYNTPSPHQALHGYGTPPPRRISEHAPEYGYATPPQAAPRSYHEATMPHAYREVDHLAKPMHQQYTQANGLRDDGFYAAAAPPRPMSASPGTFHPSYQPKPRPRSASPYHMRQESIPQGSYSGSLSRHPEPFEYVNQHAYEPEFVDSHMQYPQRYHDAPVPYHEPPSQGYYQENAVHELSYEQPPQEWPARNGPGNHHVEHEHYEQGGMYGDDRPPQWR